jgi:ABC-type lipoprotein export system ATPase subunit
LDIIAGKKVEKMSGGQRQRLAFARALGTDYSILFADEPTGNLDYHNAQKLLKILSSIVKNENRTAVIVSHDIDLAVSYADKIILIRKDSEGEGNDFHYFGVVDQNSVYEKKEKNWFNQGSKEGFANEELSSVLKLAIRDNQN